MAGSAAPARSDSVKLAICLVGIYGSFISWGYLQERVTAVDYADSEGRMRRFKAVNILNLSMALMASLSAGVALRFKKSEPCAATPLDFAKCALSNTLASPIGYSSLSYITFPMLILAKASKLMPIMLMAKIIGWIDGKPKSYPPHRYLAALMLTVGIAMFTYKPEGSKKVGGDGEHVLFGLFLVFCNLMLDGYTNARQDAIYRKHGRDGVNAFHMMFYMNSWTSVLSISYLVATYFTKGAESELSVAAAFIVETPEIVRHLLSFAVMGAVGQMFIFFSMKSFGPVITTTICLTRKFFTLCVSVFMFGHVLRALQWAGVVVVFSGIAMQTFGARLFPAAAEEAEKQAQKNKKKKKKQ